MRWGLCLAATVGLLGCERGGLRAVTGDVTATLDAVHFGPSWVGFPVTQTVTLRNSSRAERTVSLQTSAPFSVAASVVVPAGAQADVAVGFDSGAAGTAQGLLTVVDGANTFDLALDASAVMPPACAPSASCRNAAFDPTSGACVETVSVDGSACDGSNACLVGGACLAGACLGAATDCSDSNPCTADSCAPSSGCVHEPVQCAKPADPCQVAQCDPLRGCVQTDAPDGTACGPADCVTAKVCLVGQCKAVAVPDGAVCAEPSACQGQGTCQQQQCVRPAATPLTELWSRPLSSELNDFRGVTDSAQNLYWVECSFGGLAGTYCNACTVCAANSVTKDGVLRFQTVLANWVYEGGPTSVPHLLAGDHLVYALESSVGAVSTVTGAPQWSVALSASMTGAPDFATSFRIGGLTADSHGAIYVTVSRWFEGGIDAILARQSLLLKLDSTSGAVLLSRYYASQLDGPVLDEHDNVYLGLTSISPIVLNLVLGELRSLDPTGIERWRVTYPGASTPLSAFHGEVVLVGGEVRSTIDGSRRAAPPQGGQLRNALMSSTARTLLRQNDQSCQCCQTCDDFCDCPPQLPAVTAASLPPGGTTPFWETQVATSNGVATWTTLSDTAAAASGDTLVAGAQSPTWPALLGLSANGATRFACSLPATIPPGGAGSSSFSSAVALLDGRWAVVETTQCSTCLHNPPPLLRMFAVPGEAPALHGWVGAYGGPTGASRPLP